MALTVFRFDDYSLDSKEQRFQKQGQDIPLPPKVFGVLQVLVENHGRLVTNEQLLEAVWKDTFVEEGNIRYCVHSLRKVFDNGYIETIPKRGYRFNADVEVAAAEELAGTDVEDRLPTDESKIRTPASRSFSGIKAAVAGIALVSIAVVLLALAYSRNGANVIDAAHLSSIAILPFTIIGGDPDQAHVVQKGVANSIKFNSNMIRGLKVSNVEDISDLVITEHAALEAARRLGSEEMLTGTYRIEGETVRVNTVLTQVSDGVSLLTSTFTLTKDSQIDLERAIGLRIARQIALRVARLKDERFLKDSPVSQESHERYLTAQQITRGNDFSRLEEAAELMKSVAAEQPDSALLQAKYAEILTTVHGGFGCDRAQEPARRAMQLDGSIAEAYLALGVCAGFEWKWEEAEQSLKRAFDLDPNLDRAYLEYGQLLDFQRRFAEAEVNLKKALDLRPFVPLYNIALCQHYYFDLKPEEALNYCNRTEQVDPGFWLTPKVKFWIYAHQGRWDDVFDLDYGGLSEKEVLDNPLARALYERNEKLYWEIRLHERLKSKTKSFSPVAIATEYMKTGDREKALEYLEIAAEDPKYELYRIYPDPIFRPLWKEPRFIEAMRKNGLGE